MLYRPSDVHMCARRTKARSATSMMASQVLHRQVAPWALWVCEVRGRGLEGSGSVTSVGGFQWAALWETEERLSGSVGYQAPGGPASSVGLQGEMQHLRQRSGSVGSVGGGQCALWETEEWLSGLCEFARLGEDLRPGLYHSPV
eukprot:1145174-Pelagomonas_calceolata.AAC.1